MQSSSFVRRTIATLATGAAVASLAVAASALEITVNGQMASFDPAPIIQGGRVFVPLRGVFERLGASVVYQAGVINATGHGRTVSLKIGSTTATVDGQPQQLDSPPFIIGASTFVPLRFVSQALGAAVNYNAAQQVVSLVTRGGGPPPPPIAAPPPTFHHVLIDRIPAAGSVIGSQRPLISGRFNQPVDAPSVRLILDGRDVTPFSTIWPGGYEFAPPSPLAPIRHSVDVSGHVENGPPFNERYSFVSGSHPYFSLLEIGRPLDGSSVPPTFELSGRTVAGAHVHVVAGSEALFAGGAFRFGTGSFIGDTTAGPDGRFAIRVALSAIPGGTIGVTVISTDPAFGEAAEKKLHLHAQ